MNARQGAWFARIFSMIVLGACATIAHAVEVRPLIKGGYDFGGDTLFTVVFDDGHTQPVRANEGFYMGGGVLLVSEQRTIETELSLAYKVAQVTASNGNVKFTRWPLEALVFYRWQQFRLGGGLTYHLSPELDGSGFAGALNDKFKDAPGVVLQGDWLLFSEKIGLGLRYTNVKYEAKTTNTSAKGEGIGVAVTLRF